MHRRTILKGSAAASLAWNLPAFSDTYPSQRIRIIVASAPGAVTDTAGRAVAEVLTRRYGQPVVVENRPGAGGLVGLQAAAQAKPDGYTLVTGGLGNHVIPPVTIRNLPFDIVKAFVPIAQVAEFLNVLVVGTDSPYKSVQDLIRAGKAATGRPLSYASVGAGTSSHLTSELFAQRVGLKLHHVPYGNISTSLVDITGGNVDFGFANLPPTLPLLKSGKLKALGVSSAYRSRHLPEVPSVEEQGVADFDVSSWMGIYGQSEMPQALVHELSQVITEGLRSPEHQDKLSTAGFEPKTLAAEAFAERNRSELVRWAAVAKAADISVEYGG